MLVPYISFGLVVAASSSASATALPYLDKTDFLKLQNGR